MMIVILYSKLYSIEIEEFSKFIIFNYWYENHYIDYKNHEQILDTGEANKNLLKIFPHCVKKILCINFLCIIH